MFVIRGKYPGLGWEDIDKFSTWEEAEDMLREYHIAYGPEWTLTIKKQSR